MKTQKKCSKCSALKHVTEFHKDCSSPDGLYSSCAACKNAASAAVPKEVKNARARRWYRLNHERAKQLQKKSYLKHRPKRMAEQFARSLMINYQLSVQEYESMVARQSAKCAICYRPETSRTKTGEVKKLSVDHNHSTGEVRGLLCDNCNRGIGMLQEDTSVLQNAIRYLSGGQDD